MTVSQQTLDNWLAKGFDGLCAFVETRSREDREFNEIYLDSVQYALDMIDVALRYEPNSDKEDPDELIFTGLAILTQLLVKRFTTNVRELGPQIKENYQSCATRLSQALPRLKGKINVSKT